VVDGLEFLGVVFLELNAAVHELGDVVVDVGRPKTDAVWSAFLGVFKAASGGSRPLGR
jgi:hypothetical protein